MGQIPPVHGIKKCLDTRKNTRKKVDKSWQSGIVTGDILALD